MVTGTDVRLLQISSGDITTIDRLVDMIPGIVDKISAAAGEKSKNAAKEGTSAVSEPVITDPAAGI